MGKSCWLEDGTYNPQDSWADLVGSHMHHLSNLKRYVSWLRNVGLRARRPKCRVSVANHETEHARKKILRSRGQQ